MIDLEAVLGDVRQWTTAHVVARRAELSGDAVFIHHVPDGRNFSFREAHRYSNGIAHALRAMGVQRGEHVASLMDNCPEAVFLHLALGKLDAVSVPINTAARGQLLRYYLSHADCSTVVLSASSLEAFALVAPELPLLRRVIVLGDVDAARALLPACEGGIGAFPGIEVSTDDVPASSSRFTDLAYLLYTSGTSGPSKAIMVTHANAGHWARSVAKYRYFEPGDIDYVMMPLFHANALLMSVTTALFCGTTVALTQRFSASRFWDDIRKTGATRFNAIGAIAQFMFSQPPSPLDRDHKLRFCALAPPPPFVHQFMNRFGLPVLSGYGLSDFGSGSCLPLDAPPDKAFSNGVPNDEVDIRIVDDDDFDVPTGEIGEIVMRSKNAWSMPLGYYKMPEATLAAYRNLWFHTGDHGRFDGDGYLHFTGRKKDAIRRRGENISAYEVESVLVAHPAVEHVAVYALRSEFSEDEVAASIVLKAGSSLTHEALIDFCRTAMGHYMVPRFLEFVDELPLTPTSKIEKYKLVARAQADMGRMWDRDRMRVAS